MDPLRAFAPQIRELMSVSPDEFTWRRDALVRRLRDEGARDIAAEIAGLRRPSPALWAANQLGTREPAMIRDLLQSGEALRDAQGRMLAGEVGVELTEPAEDHRRAVLRAVDAGREALHESGRPATAAMVERLRETLVGASLSESSRTPLAEGRLLNEVPAASIGFSASPSAPTSNLDQRREREKAVEAGLRAKHERDRRRREAEDALAGGEKRRDAAQERLQTIRDEREGLERVHADALRRKTDADRAVSEAEALLTRARDEATAADRESARANERAQTARAAEAAAQAELDEARAVVDRARQGMRAVDRERDG